MVELQEFHLTSYRQNIISKLLTLMKLQFNYINEIYRVFYLLNKDIIAANNAYIVEFIKYFNMYVQYHASREGFSMAIETVQIYHFVVLERLLEEKVIVCAEQLELAISCIEEALRDPAIRINPQVMVIDYNLSLLEENELKIIESLETLLINSRKEQLEN